MKDITESIVTIAVAIIGLATLAVIVGRNARTSQVIDSASKGLNGSKQKPNKKVKGGSSFNKPARLKKKKKRNTKKK
jgi:hypothetical protein